MVNGVPRSGTSAIGHALGNGSECSYRFQPLYSYKYRNKAHLFKGINGLNALIKDLDHCDDNFIRNGMPGSDLDISESELTNTMVIKHVRYHEYLSEWIKRENTKLLCIIRDPRACIYSQISISKEWKGSLKEHPDWINAPHLNSNISQYFGLSGWLRFCYMAEALKSNHPNNVIILRYEEFNKNNQILHKIADNLKLPVFLGPEKERYTPTIPPTTSLADQVSRGKMGSQ